MDSIAKNRKKKDNFQESRRGEIKKMIGQDEIPRAHKCFDFVEYQQVIRGPLKIDTVYYVQLKFSHIQFYFIQELSKK